MKSVEALAAPDFCIGNRATDRIVQDNLSLRLRVPLKSLKQDTKNG
jgi:hypothetical protein